MRNLSRVSVQSYVLLLFILVTACRGEKKDKMPPQGGGPGRNAGPLTVEAMHLSPESLSSTIEVPGSLLAFEETEIRSEISGRIVKLNLSEGRNVSRGTVLVKLFDGDLQAQLRKLQVQLQIAQKTADRQKELLSIGGISQQEYDLSELQINNLKADIELVKVNIDKTEIKAPYSGRLGLKNISIGAYISPANLLTTLSEVKHLKLQFTVPEKYGSQIKKGQEVFFQIDGSTRAYQANVIATETGVEEETRSLIVRAKVRALDRYLVPGAFAKVRMVLGKQENALLIPTEAVLPQGRKKQVILYKGGKAFFTDITTGIRDSARIQVLSGLNVGDTVITTGLLFLREGAEVKIGKLH